MFVIIFIYIYEYNCIVYCIYPLYMYINNILYYNINTLYINNKNEKNEINKGEQ